jgi:GT2 family glycosyltransferase
VIVDGSSDEYIEFQDELSDELSFIQPDYVFLRTKGGKPTALNLSLKYLRESKETLDAVVFLDDDISFRLEDLETGISYLKKNNICGLSPIIVNEGDTCFRIRHLNRSSIFHFRKSGVLTKGGDNYWFNYRNIQENWLESEWLPGGTVIYDWLRINRLSFGECLENPNLMGYALGDDVDFSIKARDLGHLGCLQEIQVIHSSPATSHRNSKMIDLARAKWKAYLVYQYPIKFSIHRVVLIELLRAVWHGVLKGKPNLTYHSLSIFLREFVSESKIQAIAKRKNTEL